METTRSGKLYGSFRDYVYNPLHLGNPNAHAAKSHIYMLSGENIIWWFYLLASIAFTLLVPYWWLKLIGLYCVYEYWKIIKEPMRW